MLKDNDRVIQAIRNKLVILISNAASFFVQIFVQKIWHNLLHTQDDSCAESVSYFFAWQQQQQQKQHLTI